MSVHRLAATLEEEVNHACVLTLRLHRSLSVMSVNEKVRRDDRRTKGGSTGLIGRSFVVPSRGEYTLG